MWSNNANGVNKTIWSTNWGVNGSILLAYDHPSSGSKKFGFFDHTFNNGNPLLISSSTFEPNQWHHVVISRSGSTVKMFVNGTEQSSATQNTNLTRDVFAIGSVYTTSGTETWNGYISNLRVVKGTAVYTSNFNPSTIPLTGITNTSLLLNFTNAAIFDGVKLNNIETVGGAQINTSIKKFGTGSIQFDGTGDRLETPSNANFAFGTGDFTIEFWMYSNDVSGASQRGFLQTSDTAGGLKTSYTSGIIIVQGSINTGASLNGGLTANVGGTIMGSSTAVINTATWYHVALVRASGIVKLYLNGSEIGSATITANCSGQNLVIGGYYSTDYLYNGYLDDLRITKGIARYTSNFTPPNSKLSSLIPNYLVSRSLRFNSADSTYLSRTPRVAGNRKTWTWSGWVKRSNIGTFSSIFSVDSSINRLYLLFDSTDTLRVDGQAIIIFNTNSVYRDLSSWYHIFLSVDTTQSNAVDRFKLYVNSVQITSFGTDNRSSIIQNTDLLINSVTSHNIGRDTNTSSRFFNGYMSEVNFIDGQALTPDSFGERNTSTGVWSPKEYTGTYGTNGFHLNFSDITQIGRDFSGNNNNWTPNNFSVTPGVGYDSLTDVPTPNGTDNGFGGEVRGNYATLNPLRNPGTGFGTISNGNLQINGTQGVINCIAVGTMSFAGKMYCEITIVIAGADTTGVGVGLIPITSNQTTTAINMTTGIYYLINGNKRINGVNSSYGSSYTSGDIIGIAVDTDTETVTFYKNNISQTTISGTGIISIGVLPYIGFQDAGSPSIIANFGQRPFAYQMPTGFKTLNTDNLPTPTIGGGGESNLSNKYMDITTYTGTGTAQSIFNSGFKPDFVWIKSRSAATSHAIYDNIRGVQKRLSTDSTAAEVTDTTGLSSFDDYGFSIGALSQINTSGATYVAWQWRAGDTVSSNNSGTITSQVRVSTLSGFSIVTYIGTGANATVGHGLGVAPKMIIVKGRGNAYSWPVWHNTFNVSEYIYLNGTFAKITFSNLWNQLPTSTTIGISGDVVMNQSAVPYVAYCFAEIEGYSKFGSYLGNNSTNGTFVYTGFKPKYILIKCSTATTNWVLYNSIVNAGNPVVNELFANLNNAENSVTSGDEIDFLSNGFKLRSTNAAINDAQTYIYAAFAETPFKYATGALTPEVKETVSVEYLVIAGGGAGGGIAIYTNGGGGGGAGGYRTSTGTSGGGASAESILTLNLGTTYTVTVGGGGTGVTSSTGNNGSNSVFSTVTSIGGGGGATEGNNLSKGNNGGSGGGASTPTAGRQGLGTANQGFDGAIGGATSGGGGGGSSQSGFAGSGSSGGKGGNGVSSSITGSPVTRGGGGGGGRYTPNGGESGLGGAGGGGGGATDVGAGNPGSVNTGGGGGGATSTYTTASFAGGNGGSGIVVISYPNTEPNLTLSVGIQYATNNGTVTTDIITAGQYEPSYTPTGFKVYEFRGTGGVPLNISWQD